MNVKNTNNNFEQYKRIVKFSGSAVIVLLELAAYYYVWMNYYNKNMTVAFSVIGSAQTLWRIKSWNL